MMGETSKLHPEKVVVDDRIVRLIGIPFFGLVIPSATGLMKLSDFSASSIIHYFYFVMVAWVIWEGNRYLLFRYYPIIYRSRSIFQKYILITGLNIFYSAPVSLVMLYAWKWTTQINRVNDPIILNSTILIVVCVIFVTNVYEKALFVKENDKSRMIREQLERGKIQAELEALKNQIDPHFMFNALNSISYLVEHDAPKARAFIENLAEVYRYILRSKDKNLIMLKDEIIFMNAYISLLEIRYDNSFKLKPDYANLDTSAYLIPPVSLMVAIENSVKHNRVSAGNPLILELNYSDESLVFSNRIAEKNKVKSSTQTGLANLKERFIKLTGKEIEILSNTTHFILKIPLLKLTR
jgi:sensor histidine kinase YesM